MPKASSILQKYVIEVMKINDKGKEVRDYRKCKFCSIKITQLRRLINHIHITGMIIAIVIATQ